MTAPTPFSDPSRVLLWDLDGTIIDSSRDLATSINGMLADYGYAPLSVPAVVGHVGEGARNLVTRCLAERGHILQDDTATSRALSRFERHYARHLLDETTVYPGVDALLRDLAATGRSLALVSNKPEGFCRQILERLGLLACFDTVVGGETVAQRKPAPEPLWHAVRVCRARRAADREGAVRQPPKALANHSERHGLLIGDTTIDVRAARAAGMPVALVAWGLGDREEARASRPDAWIETAAALRRLIAPSR